MRTFLKLLILVPLALVAVAFAVANRQVVTVSFDPFASDLPAFALSGPLFLVLLLVVVIGVILGGVAAWLGQGRHRRGRRAMQREAADLRQEIARLKAEAGPLRREAVGYPALPGRDAA